MKIALAILAAILPMQVHAGCNTVQTPLNSIIAVNGNGNNNVAETPSSPPAGGYLVCGSYSAKAPYGATIQIHHGDVGANPLSIDTAPAGGSTDGDHRAIDGEPSGASIITYNYPTGCRYLISDGVTTKFYTHQIINWVPTSAVITMAGSIMWCSMP